MEALVFIFIVIFPPFRPSSSWPSLLYTSSGRAGPTSNHSTSLFLCMLHCSNTPLARNKNKMKARWMPAGNWIKRQIRDEAKEGRVNMDTDSAFRKIITLKWKSDMCDISFNTLCLGYSFANLFFSWFCFQMSFQTCHVWQKHEPPILDSTASLIWSLRSTSCLLERLWSFSSLSSC